MGFGGWNDWFEVARIEVFVWLMFLAGSLVEGHALNEYSGWGVYASGSNRVVGIHGGFEIEVTGSDWDGVRLWLESWQSALFGL